MLLQTEVKRKIHVSMQNQWHSPLTSKLTSCLYSIHYSFSLPSFVNQRAHVCVCTHISNHMTCRSHLMKPSGNECSSLMTEAGGTSPTITIQPLFFFPCLQREGTIRVRLCSNPKPTSSSDTRPVI